MTSRPALLAALVCAALAGPGRAQDVPTDPDAVRAIAQAFANSMDENADGDISAAEIVAFAEEVFVSLDTDGSGEVSVGEFQDWEFGFGDLAAFRGREQAYRSVLAMVHDMFDRDRDGLIDAMEHREAILFSRDGADRDRDGRMTSEEFLRDFIYSMALRAALDD